MRLKIKVNIDGCLGHGQCELAAPELFRVNEEGLVELLKEHAEGDKEAANLQAAIARCPERIISYEEAPDA